MDARLAIRRKPQFRDAEHALLTTLNNLDNVSLESVDILHIYDVFGASPDDIKALAEAVVCDERVDDLVTEPQLQELVSESASEYSLLGVEPLPGQYDQRADAAEQALRLLQPGSESRILSAELYVLRPAPTSEALAAIRGYLINPVEAGEKDMTVLRAPQTGKMQPLIEYPDFLDYDDERLGGLLAERGMAMSLADLKMIRDYFRSEGRAPTEVELAVLDTYWSDHCRHTTFNTELTDIEIAEPRFADQLAVALRRWDELRAANGRAEKPRTLMDLGTIVGRELRRTGVLANQEVSEEINACSVHVPVVKAATDTTDSGTEPWLLMFKNETHNHPTEIEPFGGAATCLGGAIRDPLSGRSWVYQALRLSGAGDINTPRSETLPGKLPQADISTRATGGYSSYGNQIGLATTGVREFMHPGYVAKRMELGAVVAAAPEANVRRLTPHAGDVVILLGGRTGRDGIGGATGSSKAHNQQSLAHSGAEVQKGNPVNERKIQRLFRNPQVAQMIVRCNDFGAGGVAVAVGELAPGLDIHLERVPLKYAGLNAREIAISESQERMAVVVRAADAERFTALAETENLEATQLAEVTDTGRLRMFLRDEKVLDLARSFVDTNGAPRSQKVKMCAPTSPEPRKTCKSVLETLAQAHAGSQEGMVEQFDATVGRSTVLMPYGGARQKTDEPASIQTLPADGGTDTASIITYGYSPTLAEKSPYLMGAYSLVEALSRLVAAGGDAEGAWLTVQEYFQRPDDDPQVWGDVLQALLGLLQAQDAFQVAAIGGKDSMSGSFGDELHVPPTLVSFAVGLMDAAGAVSATLPATQTDVYYLPHLPLADGTPDYRRLRANFQVFHQLSAAGGVLAASPILPGGLGATLVNMTLGNNVGFFASSTSARQYLRPGEEANQLAGAQLGGIVFAVDPQINITPLCRVGGDLLAGEVDAEHPQVIYLGATTDKNHRIDLGFESFEVDEALAVMERGYAQVYPLNETDPEPLPTFATVIRQRLGGDTLEQSTPPVATDTNAPRVLLPVFPGTNSEYDMAEAFKAAGAETEFLVIRNLTPEMLAADTTEFIARLADPAIRILAFSGGFSLGDEPDGSAKFMSAFLRSEAVTEAMRAFTGNSGLVLGVCNGFQALVKSGFLPYGDPARQSAESPTLAHNRQLRHVSRIATTRVATTASPWLAGFTPGQLHRVPVSHGEGRFVVSEQEAERMFTTGQVAFQYVDSSGAPTMSAPDNPNGSSYAIEGIISPDGMILGKMGHPERYRPGLMRNIPEIATQDIFVNAVTWCRSHPAA